MIKYIKEKKQTWKSKVFLSMLFSYFIAFLIPLIIGVGGFVFSITLLDKQVKESNRISLYRLCSILDANLKNINSIEQQLEHNSNLQRLNYSSYPFANESLVSAWKLQKEMNLQKLTNDLVESIYVTFTNNDMILSTEGLFSQNDFERHCKSALGMSYDYWEKSIVFEGTTKTWINVGESDTIAITKRHYVISGAENNKSTITVFINPTKLYSLMDSLKFTDDSMIMIQNSLDQIVADERQYMVSYDIEYMELKDAPNIFSDRNTRTVISHMESKVNDWQYILSVPNMIFSKKTFAAISILVGYILICIVLGVFLIPKAAAKHYSPIKRMMNKCLSRLEVSENSALDEYGVIEKELTNLLNKIINDERVMLENKKQMVNTAVSRIIKGHVRNQENIKTILNNYNIDFPNPGYSVVLFSVEEFGTLVDDEHLVTDDSVAEQINFILRSVIEEVISEMYPTKSVVIEDAVACLVNVPEDKNVCNNLKALSEKINTFVYEKFGIVLSIAIGSPKYSISEITNSYQDALSVMEFIQTTGIKKQVIIFGTIDNSSLPFKDIQKLTEFERKFLNCMISKDYKNAREVMDEMLSFDFISGCDNINLVEINKAFLINILTIELGLALSSPDIIFTEGDPIQQLKKAKSIPQIKEILSEIFNKIIECSEEKENITSSRLDEILEYLNENYKDPQLTIASIAEKHNVSSSYLSRMFKNLMGKGVLDYLHGLRIEEAKRLMRETNMSIKKISYLLGYYNSITMTRAFRRYEGVTPTDYKNMLFS